MSSWHRLTNLSLTVSIARALSQRYAIAFHAAASLGAIITTINAAYAVPEVAHQLEDVGADFLITISALRGKAAKACASNGSQGGTKVQRIYLFDGTDDDDDDDAAAAHSGGRGGGGGGVPASPPVSSYNALLSGGEGSFPADVVIKPSDVVVIPYSSGTSGLPKVGLGAGVGFARLFYFYYLIITS